MSIEIEINNTVIKANEGEKLITVCDRENINIPRFCYHKNLTIAANCRMCLVQLDGSAKPVPACSTSVSAGMKVITQGQEVEKSQKAVMDFLLINHPLDCPICDQGGECELQDVAINYGSNNSFFNETKRVKSDKDIGPLIQTDMTRCIHCTRCVRFGDEIAGLSELGITNRGENMTIETFLQSGVTSELSGNMIDICPVGALTSKPFRFAIRSWQMQNHNSIARHDLIGSNISVQTYANKIYRITARENTNINQTWISDKDRFSYESLNSDNRLLKPKIKVENKWQEVSWKVALDFAVKGLKKSVITNNNVNKLASLANPISTLEELYLLKKLTNLIGSKNTEYRLNIKNIDNYSYLNSTIKINQISKVNDIVIVGSNLRLEQVMLNYYVRQASLNGARIRVIASKKIDFNFTIHSFIYTSPNNFAKELQNIKLKKNSLVILGEQINFSNDINAINYQTQQLMDKFTTKLLNVSSSANTLAARKIGFVSEKPIDNMRSYILLGIDENFDFVNKKQMLQNIKNAKFVIALNSFADTNKLSDVVLPIAGIYETPGSHINIDNVIQRFSASVNPPDEAKPAWKVIKVLADMLKLKDFDYINNEEITQKALNNTAIKDKIVNNVQENNNDDDICVVWQNNYYNSDIFLRNSKALQKTLIAQENYAYMNQMTADKLQVDNHYQSIAIKISKDVADNCIMILSNTAGSL